MIFGSTNVNMINISSHIYFKIAVACVSSCIFFTACENLIADEGSILFSSKQLKQFKIDELPTNIIVYASTSQLLMTKGDGLRNIKTKYDKEYPTNITAIKYFEKTKEEGIVTV